MPDIRILIVEDEILLSHSLEALLHENGYANVMSAGTAEEARKCAVTARPDMAILDINLDGPEDGISLAGYFRTLDIPIVFLTAHSDASTIEKARQMGPYGYLTKPVNGTELIVAVEIAVYRFGMEKKLRISEEKYRVLFESIPMGITVSDREGNIIESNSMAESLLGLHRDDQVGVPIDGEHWRIVRPDGSDMLPGEYASVRALKEKRLVENVEMGLIKGDRGTTWINVTAAPVPLDDYGVVIAYSDVTERKKIEDVQKFIAQSAWVASGEDFFKSLARYLSGALGMDYVRIDQLAGDGLSAQSEVVFADGRFDNGDDYVLEGTPLRNLLIETSCVYPADVRRLFPDDVKLREREAESYAGTLLTDSRGRPMGFISAMGRKPMENPEAAESVLRMTAVRTAGELERGRLEIFQAGNANILELTAMDVPLKVIFFFISRIIRERDPEMLCCIMVLSDDGRVLNFGAGPDLPDEFNRAMDGIEIGPDVGSCGTAAFTGKPVIADNIENDFRWERFRDLALSHNLRACWSLPLLSSKNRVLGTIAVYARTPRSPDDEQLQIMEAASHLAAIAIESKGAREKLHRLSQAIEHSPSIVVITDREGRIEYVNPRFTEISGYTQEEAIGQNPKILNAGVLEGNYYRVLWETISSGRVWRGEFCNRKKNGEIYWEQASISPITDVDGVIVSYVAVKDDITERKRTEEELRINLKRTEALLHLSQMVDTPVEELGAFVMKTALELTSSDLGFINLISEDGSSYIPLAYSQEAMSECSLGNIDNFPHAGVGWLQESADQKKALIVNDYGLDNPSKKGLPEGHVRLERFMAVPILDQGRVTVLAGVANKKSDYTGSDLSHLRLMADDFWGHCKMRRKEDELSRERNRLLTLIDNIPDHIYHKDVDGKFVLANASATRSFGLVNPGELVGKTDFDFLSPGEAEQSRAEERLLIEKAKSIIHREMNVESDGFESWYAVTKAPLRAADGTVNGIVGIHRDITMVRTALENLKVAKETAENANRAKSAFLANMSHELRTPLNAVIGFSELLRDEAMARDPEQRKSFLGYIHQSGLHLLEMVNDVLDLSKIEAGKLELEKKPFSLHAMLTRVHTTIQSLSLKKSIRAEMDIDPSIGFLDADEVRLKQVIFNLLSNAVKFTGHGGRIGISATGSDETVRITVWDEGTGIPESEFGRIFRPFEQVKNAGAGHTEGTGLGLAIARRLVEMHGGVMELESEVGRGSRFTVILPGRSSPDETCSPSESLLKRNPNIRAVGGATALVVDDNEINRELVKTILVNCGCRVKLADSGEEALDASSREDFDIIFMDVQMPGMGGIEAARRIKEQSARNIPIIALTAYAMKGDREKFIRRGMDDYISKPVEFEKLYGVLEKHAGLSFCPDEDSSMETKKPYGFNAGEAAASLRISLDDYLVLARKFLMKSAEYTGSLREALGRGDMEKLSAEAHKLKGAALNLRFGRAGDRAGVIEKEARAGNQSGLEEIIKDIEKALAEVCRALDEFHE